MLSHTVATGASGGAAALVNIWLWNREGYVRSAIHIFVTYYTRTLPLWLVGIVNVPILVCQMISRTNVVIPKQVSYKFFSLLLWSMGISQHL